MTQVSHSSVRRKDPEVGDPVHVEGWKQPNGCVLQVSEDDDSVLVWCPDTGDRGEYTWTEVRDQWTDKFGGTYLLTDE